LNFSPGSRIGPYEITAKLGQGGMGEVWRARDTKLGREVAIKILPPAFTQDVDRLARFEREARVLASLNHPNIAAIYGLEDQDGSRGLVMELVEGETIADRLARGTMATEEALAVFRQIAEALEAAHAQGIVHRDLKPQNVKLRPDGTVKVLDFGLAKATEPGTVSGPSNPTFSPTLTTAGATAAGVILGTAAYMSPEQARGRAVDKRSDIWAFGAVLFEALTGRRLFEGETVTDTLAAVLRAEIDWKLLPAETPTSLRNLLRWCLERDPKNRLHDVADARIVLAELAAGRHEEQAPVPRPAPQRPLAPWIAAALAVGIVAGGLGLRLATTSSRPADASVAPASFRQLTALPGGEGHVAIAADGQSFAYVKPIDGQKDIFVQRVDGRNPILVTGSCKEDDEFPAFSPDGRRIAFHSACAGGGLFVMGATGESVRKITDFGFSPVWSPDGREIAVVTERLEVPWGRVSLSELWAVDVESGARRRISEHDATQPSWSPDGKRIAFWGLRGDTAERDIWTVAADGSQLAADAAIPVTDDADLDWNPVWTSEGTGLYFVSTRGGTMNLWRQTLDPRTGQASGAPRPMTAPSSWAGWISVSRDGRRLAFVDRNQRTTLERAPFDASRGVLTGPPLPVPLGTIELYDRFDLTADGGSVLFANSGLPQFLFLARVDGSDVRQLSEGPYRDRQAVFSPDGQWIVFQTTRWPSQFGLVRPDGSGMRGLVSDRTDGWFPVWAPDGKRVAASSQTGAYLLDPWATDAAQAATSLPAPPDGMSFVPLCWSRDGRAIVGNLRDRVGAPGATSVYSVADSTYRNVPKELDDFACLADGRRIVGSTTRTIELVDLASGAAQTIAAAPPGHAILSVVLSRDEKWVAWIEATDESDVWLAELEP
jgi:eukaryotic-like serine/threonine-protein kinase